MEASTSATSATPATPHTPQQKRHLSMQSFFSILGKVLGVAVVAEGAYGQAQTAGASSLLKPQNLANLIAGVQAAVATAHPDEPEAPAQ